MGKEEYKWHVRLVQDRYHIYKLTFKQAEQVYKYEKERDIYSGQHFFSAWEEWDYEQTVFEKIFKVDQYNRYKENLSENKGRYEKELVEQDKEKIKEITYFEDRLIFFEKEFLPDFFKDIFLSKYHGLLGFRKR
jgi:hypothetical protein